MQTGFLLKRVHCYILVLRYSLYEHITLITGLWYLCLKPKVDLLAYVAIFWLCPTRSTPWVNVVLWMPWWRLLWLKRSLFLSCLLWIDSRAKILLSCLPGRVVWVGTRVRMEGGIGKEWEKPITISLMHKCVRLQWCSIFVLIILKIANLPCKWYGSSLTVWMQIVKKCLGIFITFHPNQKKNIYIFCIRLLHE